MRILTVALAAAVAFPQWASAQGGFGFGDRTELKLVERFDADGNGRLDATERQAARASMGANGRGNGGGFRRRGFGGQQSAAVLSAGPRLTPADVLSGGRASLYDPATLRTIFLRFERDDWADELAAFYNTDVDVPATVIVDGQTYPDVGVHFRGASSYRMVPASAKKSLNLSFNFADDDQRLRGYRTLNLLNANGDPSLLRTTLYGEIARHFTPTPKVNYMRVVINDESWGVYLNAQQFNGDFTRDFFSSTKGARWKTPGNPRGQAGMEYLGESAAPYRRLYEIKTKDDPRAWVDMIRMFRVLNETPLDTLEQALTPMLDIDGVLKFLALEVALVNSDGYWTRASDYSLYQDERGQFHVIPYDFNEALSEERGFGGFGGGGGGVTLDPLVGLNDPTKPLRSRLLNVPALRARYLSHVREIAETWLDWRTLEPIARQYRALIADDVAKDTRKLYSTSAFEAGVAEVKHFADERRAYLLQATR
jgi:hypothetical protein